MANIKEYAYNSKEQLTKNINVHEIRCLGKGHTHNNKVDLNHINRVQDFMNKNDLDKVIFSSGYRCETYCKQKGWSTTSQHCKGTGTDQKFYRNGKIVPAEEICCLALDYGFTGIAYIDQNYVHLDDRESGLYRGDERYGYGNNVPNGDFYKYFGIERKDNTPKEEKYNLTRLLQKGSKGDDVVQLQKELNKLGYKGKNKKQLETKSKIFGEQTGYAVRQFQKAKKIKADEKVGKDTAHNLGWLYQGK